MSSEKLLETFINAVVGFGTIGPAAKGYSEEYCKEVLENIEEEGSEALYGIAERMAYLLREEKNASTTGAGRE